MGITLGQLRKWLIGELDVIPPASTKERINDALREIYDDYEWGFLFEDGFIRAPKVITGTAQVTKFSNEVIVSQSITDAITSVHQFDVDLFEKQFRNLSSKEVDRGFIYKIIDWDADNDKLTIDPPYQDITNSSANVQIFKAYYKPPYYQPPYEQGIEPVPDPIIDFKRFEYIISPTFQRRLILNASQAELHRNDPYRELISEPRFLIPHSFNSLGEPLFELYPFSREDRVFRVKYLRNGNKLTTDSSLIPNLFTKDLVMTKAKQKSYEWAKANSDKLKIKAQGKFDNLIALAKNDYQKLLADAMKKDEEIYPKAYQGNFLDYFSEYPYFDNWENMGETLILNF